MNTDEVLTCLKEKAMWDCADMYDLFMKARGKYFFVFQEMMYGKGK